MDADRDDGRDDATLLAAHVAGDADAFAVLVRRHRDRLWAVALRTMRDPGEAADALQDALLSAFRNAAGYRGDAAVTTWLHRVVVNACLDRMRRRAVRPAAPLGDTDVPTGRDEHSALESRLVIQAALARLPDAQRVAIVLVDLQDLSVTEAAAFLGVAEGTIKSRCSRGRLALARLLRGEDPEIEDGAGGNLPGIPRVAPADRSGVRQGPGGSPRRSRGEEGERGHAWTAS
jgi:RNA polymerase sigma-70 factor, ECF subfamily